MDDQIAAHPWSIRGVRVKLYLQVRTLRLWQQMSTTLEQSRPTHAPTTPLSAMHEVLTQKRIGWSAGSGSSTKLLCNRQQVKSVSP